MNDTELFFSLGWHHIISASALDHILFIIALSAIYIFKDWKKVLVLVTAFTIGHSLTLALSVYDIIRINNKLVEILIPCTIAITAGFNFLQKDFTQKKIQLNYFFALFFGLIHGMGFANSIRFKSIASRRGSGGVAISQTLRPGTSQPCARKMGRDRLPPARACRGQFPRCRPSHGRGTRCGDRRCW